MVEQQGAARGERRRAHAARNGPHLKAKRGLFDKPRGVKCAQSEKCFNKLADAKGGREECDSDGENCEAFCVRGYSKPTIPSLNVTVANHAFSGTFSLQHQ